MSRGRLIDADTLNLSPRHHIAFPSNCVLPGTENAPVGPEAGLLAVAGHISLAIGAKTGYLISPEGSRGLSGCALFSYGRYVRLRLATSRPGVPLLRPVSDRTETRMCGGCR
jgi:hypothetical protein